MNYDFIALSFVDYLREQQVSKVFTLYNLEVGANIYNYILSHIDQIYEVYSSLCDEASKEVYLAVFKERVSGCVDDLIFNHEAQYFWHKCLPGNNEIVFDCGSYDGRTAVEFSQLGCKVYSFELDRLNYEKGLLNAQKYGFQLENMGVGSRKSQLKYSCGDAASKLTVAGENIAQIIDIDTYAMEHDIHRVDFIKMDIEGAELEALKGAKSVISRFKPKLAICLYHKLEDNWQLPLYIKSLWPDYEFYCRHYIIDGRFEGVSEKDQALFNGCGVSNQIKSSCETVLYCR